MVKKILFSVASIAAVAGLAFGATQAFFSDTEKSTDNLLQAGALDLKIDNTCYYNGQACIRGFWGGEPNDPQEPTNKCSCTWRPKDLEKGDTFFDLTDLKPGDWEEDTISLKVTNDAWACMEAHLTKNADNSCVVPEVKDDPACGTGDPNTNGDLAQNLNFIFWSDDGDNVLERDEEEGVVEVKATDLLHEGIALADSEHNLWGDQGPLKAGKDYFVGKAFCFGDLTLAPVTPDDPQDPTNSPTKDPGILCNGEPVNNAAQTDSILADISFRAVQARHNEKFLCNPPEPTATPTPTLVPVPTG